MKEEKIKVLALLPMELPKEIELDNTLEAIKRITKKTANVLLRRIFNLLTFVHEFDNRHIFLPLL